LRQTGQVSGDRLNPLSSAVAAAFANAGPLSRRIPGIRPRQGQLDMAAAVAQAIAAGEHLAVEAGAGTGKTFAYLVPLLLSGRCALLSTATQALQEQLFLQDIPTVVQSLGLPVRVALLKGRSSYVCLQRLEQARQGATGWLQDPAWSAALDRVQRWADQSLHGDLAELPGLDDRSPLRPLISSTRENCLGPDCPRLDNCHVNRARRAAQAADWVVINHHLLITDPPQRGAGGAAPWRESDVVVIDEAHRLRETLMQQPGRAIGGADLLALARDLAVLGPLRARGMAPWAYLALTLERATNDLSDLHGSTWADVQRLRLVAGVPQGLDPAHWRAAAVAVASVLDAVERALAASADAAVELTHLLERVSRLQRDWTDLAHTRRGQGPDACGAMGWLDRGGLSGTGAPAWQLVQAPQDAALALSALMGGSTPQGRSWVFTSASLGTDDALSWFTRPLGLDQRGGLRTLRVSGSIDHASQASLYIPDDLQEPSQPGHTVALAEKVARWATRLGGRTLVLTTTLQAGRQMAQTLDRLIASQGARPLEILHAGRLSRRALLARFRAAGTDVHHPGAVLVASMAFWEGVDLAGDALQLLVIDKLPFAPPNDPLIEARVRESGLRGERPFDAVHLPEACMALKQGAGRLIRTETDRGVLVIGDRRLLTRSYAGRLLNALPPMCRLMDESEMVRALDTLVLTRASTKGH
jgi:ATP-dependent DNA helicase DinG